MILPKFFAIYSDISNPLWGKYINWLNRKYETNLVWNNDWLYWTDQCDKWYWSYGAVSYKFIEDFNYTPTIFTLEDFDKLTDSFK